MKLRTTFVLGAAAIGAVFVALVSLGLIFYFDDSASNSAAPNGDTDTNADWVQIKLEEPDQDSSQPATDTSSSSQ